MPKTDSKKTNNTNNSENAKKSLLAENNTLTVIIPWADVEVARDKALRKAGTNMKLDGFRKGKAPLPLVEKSVDQTALLQYTIELAFPPAYSAAVKKADVSPITQPSIDPVKMELNQDWQFTVSFAIRPNITLGKYQDVVKKALKDAEKEIVEAEASIKKHEKEDEEKKAKGEHDGHTHDHGDPKQRQEDIRLKHIFKALVASIEPKIQEILVRTEVERELRRLAQQLQQFKLTIADYVKSRNITEEQLQQEYAAQSIASLQIEFILAEVAKDQKLNVSEKEIDEMLQKAFGEKLTAVQQQDQDYRSYIYSSILKQKVISQLLSLA